MTEQPREWTIYVCPDCGGGLADAPNEGLSCDCPDDPNEDRKYPPIDSPVRVRPVAESVSRKSFRDLLDAARTLSTYTQGFSENRSVQDAKKELDRLSTLLDQPEETPDA